MSDDMHMIPGCRIAGRVYGGPVRIAVTEPATGARLAEVAGGGADDARSAVDAAQAALHGWRGVSPAQRGRALRAIAEALRSEPDDGLAQLIARETGKRIAEARGEVAFSAAFFDWFADAAAALVEEHRAGGGRRFLVCRRPLGVVAALTPWNFPASIPARKIAAALAAGCTVVFKPSELTPLSGLRLAELAEPHLPAGALTTLTGEAAPTSNALIDDPRVAGVTFTGSTRVGALVAARCAPTFTRAVLELGGRAPFIVRPDADIDAAVETLLVAKYRNNGASCIAANNVFVHEAIYRPFLEAYVDRSLNLTLGDPLDGKTDLGPVITNAHVTRLTGLVAEARNAGAPVWEGAQVPAAGSYVAPAIVEAPEGSRLWDEEIFGPVTAVRPYRDEEQVVAEVNSWPYGLGGYVCGRDTERAAILASRLEIGIVGINNGAPNTPEVPFGGFKRSGIGREGGFDGLSEFAERQTLAISMPQAH